MSANNPPIVNDIAKLNLASAMENTEISEQFMLSIAREIAMDMETLPTILHNHGVSMAAYERMAKSQRFLGMLREAMTSWGSAQNVTERIGTKMQYMVEQSLPMLHKELIKEGLTTPKVELIKTLMKGGNIGVDPKNAGGGAERVTININMGAKREGVTVDMPLTIDHEAEEAA